MVRQQQQKQPTSGPLVIGLGLMRTGTNSQMKALELLLGGPCYHMMVIMGKKRHHLELWYKASKDGLTKETADKMLADFYATTDFPTAHFYPELMEIYPNAKFVLSIREPKRWVESVRGTIFQGMKAIGRMLPPTLWLYGLTYFLPMHHSVLQSRLGLRFDMSDEEMMQVFERHTEAVKQTIPKERLLVFKVSDGWDPLCQFLDLPVPDVPFPNVNDSAQFKKIVLLMNVFGAVTNLGFCSAVGVAVWFGVKYCLRNFA